MLRFVTGICAEPTSREASASRPPAATGRIPRGAFGKTEVHLRRCRCRASREEDVVGDEALNIEPVGSFLWSVRRPAGQGRRDPSLETGVLHQRSPDPTPDPGIMENATART